MAEFNVCALDDLPIGGKKSITLEGKPILLLRAGGGVFAVGNRCAHMNLPMSVGTFDPHELSLKCRFHGAIFDIRTGQLTKNAWLLGSIGKDCLPTYPTRIDNGRIFVEV